MTDPITPERIAELRQLLAGSSAGDWKLWGMDVMADPRGTSDLDEPESGHGDGFVWMGPMPVPAPPEPRP
jgi:hypothetical protein